MAFLSLPPKHVLVLPVALLAVAAAAATGRLPASRPDPVAVGNRQPTALPGLHNVFRLSAKLYSGSVPEGETGFCSLCSLGVRTIISVDGARPDVATAHRFGLLYVHLPFGYD